MKTAVKMITVLSIMGLLSGGALAHVYKLASPLIEKNRLEELKKAIFVVLPDAKNYKETKQNNLTVYEGVDANGSPVGIAFEAIGSGFQGKITMMVGIQNDFKKMTGMLVLNQIETPGLGNKIAFDSFQDQFKGLSVEPEITYVKNKKKSKPNEIEAITAATISSIAVVKIINKQIAETGKALGKR